ncbi:hypothetical protein [Rubritalea tangerina]|uniref:Uncharacterized protein n=1 Tax=Rubritalea tangerina TaxID=430798 RepID=A0ABW4ZB90_9BACT
MKWWRGSFIYVLGLMLLGQGVRAQVNAPVGENLLPEDSHNLSTNKIQKVVVKGDNNKMRMAIASIANRMGKELHLLLKEPEAYQGDRILFIDMYEDGKARGRLKVRPSVTPFENDLVIRLLVDTRSKVDRAILAHGILDVYLYRRGLEGVKNLADGQEAVVPPWLSYGLIEAIAWKKDSSRRRVFEHLLSNPEVFPLDKVLSSNGREVRAFDATNESFYRAGSCALVLALIRQDGGEEAMQAFLSEVVLFEGEIDILLRKHFPDLSIGANALKKVWSLQVAEMAAPKMVETFSIADSDKKLVEALTLSIADEGGNARLVPFDQYFLLDELSKSQKIQATEALRQNVVQLSNRCHPVYRPILLEYAKLGMEVSQGNTENVSVRLPVLADERQKMVIADERCRDYLDWYQITRAYEVRGDFSGYMNLKESLAMEREHKKDTSIDPYLDKVQKLMGTRESE